MSLRFHGLLLEEKVPRKTGLENKPLDLHGWQDKSRKIRTGRYFSHERNKAFDLASVRVEIMKAGSGTTYAESEITFLYVKRHSLVLTSG